MGVAPSALRYYEDIGVVARPARGSNGYRTYDDADVARLSFVTQAKNLGIPLDDVRALVAAYDVDDCSTVAHQVVELVAVRLAETRTRMAELADLAQQLTGVAERLATSPAAGTCGAGCPCATATLEPLPADRHVFLPFTRNRQQGLTAAASTPAASTDDVLSADGAAVACSLDAGGQDDRLHQWRAVVAGARTRTDGPGGTDLTFDPDPALAARLAGLAAAEQACCPFLEFTLQFTGEELRLEVRGPDAAPGQ